MAARITRARITRLAASTADAYSADGYTSWTAVAALLLCRGYSEEQSECVMRSKLTRWTRDARHGGRRATAADLGRYLDAYPNQVRDLLEEEGLPVEIGHSIRIQAATTVSLTDVEHGRDLAMAALRGDVASALVLADALEGEGSSTSSWWRSFAAPVDARAA